MRTPARLSHATSGDDERCRLHFTHHTNLQMRNICLILNSHAGTAQAGEIERKIHQFCGGRTSALILKTSDQTTLDDLLHDPRILDYEVVVAGGGDGTVNAVASVVAGRSCAMGVLPLGTLNHFAKDLKIPTELEPALETLMTGQITAVDVGEVNGKVFVNNSSLGLYPEIVLRRESEQKRGRAKWIALAEASWEVLKWHPFLAVNLNVDGKEIVRKTALVFIGNSPYRISGVDAGTRASLTEGKLSLYVTHKEGRPGLIRLALKSITGLIDQGRDLDCMTASEVGIRMHKKIVDVAMDGEVVALKTPLQYRVRPKALNVVVPAKHAS